MVDEEYIKFFYGLYKEASQKQSMTVPGSVRYYAKRVINQSLKLNVHC